MLWYFRFWGEIFWDRPNIACSPIDSSSTQRGEAERDLTTLLQPEQLKQLIERCAFVNEMMGSPAWKSIDAEKDILQYRRKN